jgi:phosphatidyl-myo-inositol dimannoside synthase
LRKLLLVTSNFPRWPQDTTTPFVLHLAQDLQKCGWDVQVLAPHAPGARHSELLDGIKVERFRYLWPESQQTVCYQGGALLNLRNNRLNFAKLPLLVLSEAVAVARALRREKFSLVHSHWLLPQGLICGLVAKAFRIPHVTTVHGGDAFSLNSRLLRRCKSWAVVLSDAVTVNSTATLEAIRSLTAHSNHVQRIPMGALPRDVDTTAVAAVRARLARNGGPVAIFVGRLVDEKGVGDLLAATALLLPTHPDLNVVIVGSGPDQGKFEAQTLKLGIADRVKFTGWVDSRQIGDYLAAADVFVAASKRAPDGWVEAQGLTLIEAMFAGVPVVATRSGGIVDAVRHETTGLLVSEGAPHEIAAAVAKLLADDELRARLRANASELACREYTRDLSAAAFSKLFTRVLQVRRDTGPLSRR